MLSVFLIILSYVAVACLGFYGAMFMFSRPEEWSKSDKRFIRETVSFFRRDLKDKDSFPYEGIAFDPDA